jgi:2-aminoethylphosphonate-pyruvate transaminase
MNKPKLFCPGPVMTRDNVRSALLHYDICHRGKEFELLFADTQKKVSKLLNADDSYYSILISGSGTATNETVLSSAFLPGEKVLLIKNGTFGDRLEEIINKYRIPMVEASLQWGEYPDVSKIEKLIISNPDVKIVAMVWQETCTGMINPVKEIGDLCKRYDKWFFVDSVSSAGGEYIDLVENNITFTTSVSGKCIGAFPGIGFVCGKEEVFKTITADQGKNVYLNLAKHYEIATTKSQTPNTPNVTLFWALNQALTNIIDEGLSIQINRYKNCAAILRKGFKDLGLKLLLEEKYMSNTVTSVILPKGKDLEDFVIQMEELGYVVYAGKGKYFDMGMFQVANMGEVYEEDCKEFLEVLSANI